MKSEITTGLHMDELNTTSLLYKLATTDFKYSVVHM